MKIYSLWELDTYSSQSTYVGAAHSINEAMEFIKHFVLPAAEFPDTGFIIKSKKFENSIIVWTEYLPTSEFYTPVNTESVESITEDSPRSWAIDELMYLDELAKRYGFC